MRVFPFHFTGPDMDFLGIIRIAKSRRNKEKYNVHINAGGGDWDHVVDVPLDNEDATLYGFLIHWLWQYGKLEDLGVIAPGNNEPPISMDKVTFNQRLFRLGCKCDFNA